MLKENYLQQRVRPKKLHFLVQGLSTVLILQTNKVCNIPLDGFEILSFKHNTFWQSIVTVIVVDQHTSSLSVFQFTDGRCRTEKRIG